jgi:hypothetical protein
MTPRWVKAATAAMAIAAVPVAAITPVDHPAQMLAHMAGKDLVLSSPQASDLLRMFFAPQPKNDMPCVQGRNVSTIVRQPGREIKLSSFGPWPVG